MMPHLKRFRILPLLLALLMALPASACGKEKELYRAQFFELFDTVSSLVGYDDSAEAFQARAEAVKADLEEYHKLYDFYEHHDGYFNLYDINQKAGQGPVKADERILDLLDFSKSLYERSGGKMNIAMGSVLKIWHDHRTAGIAVPEKASLPDKKELEEAARHCDPDNLIIDRQAGTVELKDPEMLLDVGAVAKGYATEQVARLAEARGEEHLLLSIGGNVRAIGARNAKGEPWRVGVENPEIEKREQEPNLAILGMNDYSLVTSGLYERYYVVDGKRYHHIIDPETLFPEERFLQVSVYTKDSGLADGLSTALFNSDLDAGKALIESLEDTEAMWVLPDGTQVKSSGFEALEIKD